MRAQPVMCPESQSRGELETDVIERLQLVRDSATRFADRAAHLQRARRLRGRSPGYEREVWQQFAELGWLGIAVPEAYGGSGLGCAEMSMVAQELATALFPEPLTSTAVFAAGCLVHGDNESLKAQLLPALVRGELIATVAWREDPAAPGELALNTRAEANGEGVKLSGKKRIVVDGASADGVLVTAAAAQGMGIYWLPAESLRGRVTEKRLPDGRSVADVVLDGVAVPSAHCVVAGELARFAFTRAYDEALIVTSAELIGLSGAVLELTLEYLRTRVQFGRHIGSFQALQHRAVDLYIRLRMCRHALDEVLAATLANDLTDAERSAQASRIKARSSETSLLITREAVQMHGAMGYSDECDVGLYLSRAITLSSWLGGADVHRRRFGTLALNLAVLAPSAANA